MTASVKATKHNDIIKRKVTLCGINDIMFDRYAGDNKTQLEPHQKLYLKPGTKVIGIPSLNIISFLSASGCYIHRAVARLDKGIPNPKERPVIPAPWEITFDFLIYPNKEIKEVEIQNLFEDGGRALGLGTFRGVFGKFYVKEWA